MARPSGEHVGARIADYRKLRHLTQVGLAQRAHVSPSHISKIEKGFSPASPAVLAIIARVLSVPVAVLTGQPFTSELRKDRMDGLVAPLATAFDLYDLGPDPDVTPRPHDELSAGAEELCRLAFDTADYDSLGRALPGLIGEFTTALYTAPSADGRHAAASALAKAYMSAEIFAYRLGYHDLATVALERWGWASERAQDPLLLALRSSRRSQVLLERGSQDAALRIADRGQRLVEQTDSRTEVPSLAVAGTLHLRRAFIASRAKDEETALGHITLARELADRIGREVPRVYWTAFGPTNVTEYEMQVRVNLDQPGEAVRAARGLHFGPGHPRTWRGSDHLVVARAYTRLGRTEKAVEAMQKARSAAPQQVRYSPVARSVVQALVRRHRAASRHVASLATWAGMV